MAQSTSAATASVLLALMVSVGALATPAAEKGGRVYRWTDEKGITHYGDAVPPQYADQDQTILNHQGLTVGSVAGRKTTEQAAAGNDALELHKSQQQHDQILLATYLSVDEIELLRNRRLDVLEGQARVIGQYLEQLKALRRAQEEQMKKFRPYTAGRAAPALPERLAEEIVRTVADGESQQRALSAKQDEIARTRQEFSADIARFRELKGVVRPPGQTTSP